MLFEIFEATTEVLDQQADPIGSRVTHKCAGPQDPRGAQASVSGHLPSSHPQAVSQIIERRRLDAVAIFQLTQGDALIGFATVDHLERPEFLDRLGKILRGRVASILNLP